MFRDHGDSPMPREANSAVDIADLPPYGNGTLPARRLMTSS